MSFRCASCRTHTTGQPVRTILETNAARYPPRFAFTESDKQGAMIDRGGLGTEIKREVDLCSTCAGGAKIHIGERWFANNGTTSIRTEIAAPDTSKRMVAEVVL